MIQANECRVGNLLYDKKNNRIVAFHGLTEGHNKVIVNYANGNGIYYLEFDEVEPIKLTEEILLKCGFIKKCSTIFIIGNFKITLTDNLFLFYTYHYKIECNYLHELQNLYWCLTKQDFTTN